MKRITFGTSVVACLLAMSLFPTRGFAAEALEDEMVVPEEAEQLVVAGEVGESEEPEALDEPAEADTDEQDQLADDEGADEQESDAGVLEDGATDDVLIVSDLDASADTADGDSSNEGGEEQKGAAPTITAVGWNQSEDGKRYWSDDGTTPVSGWKRIDGSWYYFDLESFAAKTSELFDADGKTYIANASGVCPSGKWVDLDGTWYLTDSSCAARSGWAKSGSAWYYLDLQTFAMKAAELFNAGGKAYVATDSGVCPASKWVKLEESWYLTDSSCAARKGWAKSGGKWYYLDTETYVMKESEVFSDGKKDYVANSAGVCPANSWVKLEDGWYRTQSSSALAKGWAKVSGTWYYLDPETYVMKESEQFQAGGKTYMATASGACPVSSWVKFAQDWYRTDSSCAVLTGWTQSGSKWYYLSPTADETGLLGRMLTGFIEVSDKLYHLDDPSGVMTASKWIELEDGSIGFASYSGAITVVPDATMVNGEISFTGEPGWNTLGEDDRFYVNEDGSLATGWKQDGKTWYYLDSKTHVAVRGTIVTVSGTPYVFAKSGAWIDITGDSALNKRIATILRDKTGLNLRACYDYVWKNFGYASMSYWPSYSGWQADYARQMLNNGKGNCYAFASLFQFMAKACDANTKLIKGWAIGMSSGKHTPHGWVECYVDGKTYVIDPEISYESRAGDFFMFRYADCPHMDGVYYAYGKAGDTNLTILK